MTERMTEILDLFKKVLRIWYADMMEESEDPQSIGEELLELLEDLEDIKRYAKIGMEQEKGEK